MTAKSKSKPKQEDTKKGKDNKANKATLWIVLGCSGVTFLLICLLCSVIAIQLVSRELTRSYNQPVFIPPDYVDEVENDTSDELDGEQDTSTTSPTPTTGEELNREQITLQQQLVDEEVVYSLEIAEDETVSDEVEVGYGVGAVVQGDEFTLSLYRFYESEVASYDEVEPIQADRRFEDVYRARHSGDQDDIYRYVNNVSEDSQCSYLQLTIDAPCGYEGIGYEQDLLFVTCQTETNAGLQRCDEIVESLRFVRKADLISEPITRDTFSLNNPLAGNQKSYSIEYDPEKETYDMTSNSGFREARFRANTYTLRVSRFYESEVQSHAGKGPFEIARNSIGTTHRVKTGESNGRVNYRYITRLKTSGNCQYLGETIAAPCGDEFAILGQDILRINCSVAKTTPEDVRQCDRLVSKLRAE